MRARRSESLTAATDAAACAPLCGTRPCLKKKQYPRDLYFENTAFIFYLVLSDWCFVFFLSGQCVFEVIVKVVGV